MSVAAIVALAHDLLITVGVYALSGFEVTPATVTGILTILGFSLYDTVVVFDKVRENTKNLARTRQTYAEAANLAVNQTLVRSINTSIVALLPVGALLYVGVVSARLRRAQGPRARAVRRHGGRRVLLDLHRHPAARAAQGARARRSRPATPARCGTAAATRWTATPSVPTFTEDMPLHDEPERGRRRATAGAGRPRAGGDRGGRRRRSARRGPPRASVRRRGRCRRPRPPSARSRPASRARSAARRDRGADASAIAAAARPAGPRRAGLPAAGRGVQGHHPAARRPRRLHRGRRRAGRRRPRRATATSWSTRSSGIEARGFILAAPVALALGVGFVPVRKAGKLPRRDPRRLLRPGVRRGDPGAAPATRIAPGERVLLVDDVLATGGTADATRQLVERCGGVRARARGADRARRSCTAATPSATCTCRRSRRSDARLDRCHVDWSSQVRARSRRG